MFFKDTSKRNDNLLIDRCLFTAEIESEISLLPIGKSHGAYSCPTIILKVAKCLTSRPLMEIKKCFYLWGSLHVSWQIEAGKGDVILLQFTNGESVDSSHEKNHESRIKESHFKTQWVLTTYIKRCQNFHETRRSRLICSLLSIIA